MQRILIADDSGSIRKMLSSVLRDAGYEVAEAPDGQVAYEKAHDFNPDLFISDLNMPVVDGIEFVKKLRSDKNFKFTPVLILTTEGQHEKRQKGRNAGATGWLVKPFNPEKLLAVIKKIL